MVLEQKSQQPLEYVQLALTLPLDDCGLHNLTGRWITIGTTHKGRYCIIVTTHWITYITTIIVWMAICRIGGIGPIVRIGDCGSGT